MMNFTEDAPGTQHPYFIITYLNGAEHQCFVNAKSHGCFLCAVKKGFVLLTKMESITAYKNQRGQPRSGTPEQSDTPVSANDMCSLAEWPSHARRNRALLQDEAGGQKKKV
ncbi:uncharacterized protein [Triticum aestivum]|uniref:uncharacterized protein isoform X1 n=1 Tax=Triticum aestivum TaxID=4565 RepID=UPI001D033887|nr:uncharacterized protein LOC123141105 isoform X1 [Triticum aestivum]